MRMEGEVASHGAYQPQVQGLQAPRSRSAGRLTAPARFFWFVESGIDAIRGESTRHACAAPHANVCRIGAARREMGKVDAT